MNPLLSRDFRVPFDDVRAEHVLPGVEAAVREAEERVEHIVALGEPRTYQNTVAALDDLEERVVRAVNIARHLMSVANEPELRAAYNETVPVYSAFFAKLPADVRLYRAVQEYASGDEAKSLNPVRSRRLAKLLDEFRRAGVDLPDEQRKRVEQIRTELAMLATEFGNTLLDGTNDFELVISEESDLAGLPDSVVGQARSSAQAKGVDGWRFTLHAPSYLPFIKYSERRELRRRMYEAFSSRAFNDKHDNSERVRRILELRRELSLLLGYPNFADYRLELNMARDGESAKAFERDLFEKTRPIFRQEMEELERFAAQELGIERVEPWDFSFVAERLRRSRYHFDDEDLRPYFALSSVLSGLFEIAHRLYGISVEEVRNDAVWHPEVRFFEVRDEAGRHIGSFYADFFPRDSKRSGAWMNGVVNGGVGEDGEREPHLGLMVTNITPPQGEEDARLTHNEVQTLFHEFGHLLHHLLSRVELPALAGTNVPRDWVELPSHFMENWTWEREALDLFARHVETGEPIPEELFAKLQASRNYLEGYLQMRQLSFGTVDLALHIDHDPESGEDPIELGRRLRESFVLRPEFAEPGFLCAFGHIFAGGYAAGYYSYKWSEVLEADAFTRFKENGIFDRETGRAFADAILSQGDSRDQNEQFRSFMGRDPDSEALMRRNFGAAYQPAMAGD